MNLEAEGGPKTPPTPSEEGRSARVERAARALVGTRFRLHGRCDEGLDCVGVVALAMRGGGFVPAVPSGYAMRGNDASNVVAILDGGGLARAGGDAAGDVLLMRAGPAQLHLAVRTATGFVHADAGLRRVVETPGEPAWPLIAAWRIGG